MKLSYVAEEDRKEKMSTQRPKPIKPSQWAKIANMLKIGGTLEDAADLARISYGRLYRNIEAEVHLQKDIKELMADCKKHHLQKIYDGEKGWQASAWFLERMYRKQFSLIDKTQEDEERAIQLRKVVRKTGVRPQLEPSVN